ncbi:unnamed protein product [Anisakis simplex]|uniref:Uncharacterized protein n=1 Tax=Anisakis simplex TaxID=6269 RepID=A0A3P6SWE0_ANISI|nr:unnamed protein product [Anisakis simplex]
MCYGDILLGFRYFPDGLPEGVALNQRVNDSSSDDEADERSVSSMLMNDIGEGRDGGSQSATLLCSQPKDHQFETISLKSGSVCAVCKGKIWLKTASYA